METNTYQNQSMYEVKQRMNTRGHWYRYRFV